MALDLIATLYWNICSIESSPLLQRGKYHATYSVKCSQASQKFASGHFPSGLLKPMEAEGVGCDPIATQKQPP